MSTRKSLSSGYVGERRVVAWQQAANVVGLSLEEFIVVSLDTPSRAVARQA